MCKNVQVLEPVTEKKEKRLIENKDKRVEKKIEMSRGYCRHYHMKKGC